MSELREVVYCKDCIYRPIYMNRFGDVCPPANLERGKDVTCPEFHHGGFMNANMPADHFFCACGKEKPDGKS